MPRASLCAVCLHFDYEHPATTNLCSRLGCHCPRFLAFDHILNDMGMPTPSSRKIEEAVYIPRMGKDDALPQRVLVSMWERTISLDTGFVVLFTELHANYGISVTNSIEDLVDWASRSLFEPKDLKRAVRWFERHESNPEEIDEVLLGPNKRAIGWARISIENFHCLTCSQEDIQRWISEDESFGNLFEPRE